ncbi:RidA family protein [Nocardiopsis sp. RSe5-2]|uniref:RidA family protein n=1 Tax=Nocardiopsis endophytica TaxID=3018445 RepID=A0ABT4U1N5_9ACTN|nr:RidA family protein [Nocardiopsis endophytica]MDA2810591.1 RidA family protein [Nocardiopsis endophytica]
MAVTLIHPEGLPKIDLYKQVSVATGSKLVSVAGQVSWDAEQNTVGKGDLAAQVEQCYRNVATGLEAAGATFDDVVRLTVYVVDMAPEKLPVFQEGMERVAKALGKAPTPPIAVIGVAALDIPDHLVEIEATALVD